MNKKTAEKKLIELAKQMAKIHQEYNPNGEHLHISIYPKCWFNDGKLTVLMMDKDWNTKRGIDIHYTED